MLYNNIHIKLAFKDLYMIYLILLGLLFFIQLFAASWYDLAKKATDKKKAFKHKLICSAIYMASVLLCSAIKGNFNNTYTLLFIGAFLSIFIHDIVEEKSNKFHSVFSAILSVVGYIAIAVALCYKNLILLNQNQISLIIKYAIPAVVFLICAITLIKSVSVSLLIATVYLIICAILTGITLHKSGNPQSQAASCAIIMGATAIFFSSIISVFDKNNTKSLLRINLYYFGLMFISCSVAVV